MQKKYQGQEAQQMLDRLSNGKNLFLQTNEIEMNPQDEKNKTNSNKGWHNRLIYGDNLLAI